mmetsp:Transcript_1983/g.5762  ORF Transcript_1983/g.5762 Transcript_1983/m.5762 type:complete len:276 (-) Transcript_1983:388-1215(-)
MSNARSGAEPIRRPSAPSTERSVMTKSDATPRDGATASGWSAMSKLACTRPRSECRGRATLRRGRDTVACGGACCAASRPLATPPSGSVDAGEPPPLPPLRLASQCASCSCSDRLASATQSPLPLPLSLSLPLPPLRTADRSSADGPRLGAPCGARRSMSRTSPLRVRIVVALRLASLASHISSPKTAEVFISSSPTDMRPVAAAWPSGSTRATITSPRGPLPSCSPTGLGSVTTYSEKSKLSSSPVCAAASACAWHGPCHRRCVRIVPRHRLLL